MASNSFGKQFRITTWGESHGPAIGVVIDGCPPGIAISEEEIFEELKKRRPGYSLFTSLRKEEDVPKLLSGVFEGKTTGAPVQILIENKDADSSTYEEMKAIFRPSHANFTYMKKYGIYDYRGGGRASGRETACRVAAGAVAKALLAHFGIKGVAFLQQVGSIQAEWGSSVVALEENKNKSLLFCPDPLVESKMQALVDEVKLEGDSIGGVVAYLAEGVPVGLGDPIYEKLEANLAKAMLSIPASKGFEIGEGFQAACMRGSLHNDSFCVQGGKILCKTNHAGGVLAGITSGAPLYFRVAFKPTASIKKQQSTVDFNQNPLEFTLAKTARHDPCLAIRAVAVVEAMAALVLADALLMNQTLFLSNRSPYDDVRGEGDPQVAAESSHGMGREGAAVKNQRHS